MLNWKVKQSTNGAVELFDEAEGGGSLIRCLPDGRITLYEIPMYGGSENLVGEYVTLCEAMSEAGKLT